MLFQLPAANAKQAEGDNRPHPTPARTVIIENPAGSRSLSSCSKVTFIFIFLFVLTES